MTCRVYSMGLASVVTVAVAASPLPAPPEGPAPIIETEPVDRDFVPWWNGPGMDGEELYWEHEWAGDIHHAMPRSGSGGTHLSWFSTSRAAVAPNGRLGPSTFIVPDSCLGHSSAVHPLSANHERRTQTLVDEKRCATCI